LNGVQDGGVGTACANFGEVVFESRNGLVHFGLRGFLDVF
jgi:hypothetical protein